MAGMDCRLTWLAWKSKNSSIFFEIYIYIYKYMIIYVAHDYIDISNYICFSVFNVVFLFHQILLFNYYVTLLLDRTLEQNKSRVDINT